MLILNERQSHKVVKEYVLYFNRARPHQGVAQHPPDPFELAIISLTSLRATAQAVLGGLRHDYQRAA